MYIHVIYARIFVRRVYLGQYQYFFNFSDAKKLYVDINMSGLKVNIVSMITGYNNKSSLGLNSTLLVRSKDCT